MLERVLEASIRHRVLVVLAVALAALVGARALVGLPIDAVPDVSPNQVSVNAENPALSPTEMEMLVAFPIETALAGIPGLQRTRSLSRNGFAQVIAVFRDDVDLYFARQQVSERLASVRDGLPPDTQTRLGPISTGLGEVYMWTVEFAHPGGRGATPRDGRPGWQADGAYLTPEGERLATPVAQTAWLRTVQDWIVRPQLKSVPGVADVEAIGGWVKRYTVEPDPRRMAAHGLGFRDLVEALERNNMTTGAGWIEHGGEAWVVRAPGRVSSLEDIERIVVTERNGIPIRVEDLAAVTLGGAPRMGSASENGEEAVVGTALMLVGANSRTVAAAVGERVAEIAHTLPDDVVIKTVLDRTALVDATIHTVTTNLAEGALLVVVVLFALLGSFRAALIAALAIPLSMLLTAIGMAQTGVSANLMSLGAIDFGLIVDGAVIVVENCLRLLAERQRALGRPLTLRERLDTVLEASSQVRTATAYGEAIIILVYVPVLFLTGVEGKMFRPMALTVICALTAAFVLSLTFVPAMMALLVRGPVRERENPLIRLAKRVYAPALQVALRARWAVVGAGVLTVVGALVLFGRLGREFVPTLSELDLLVHAIRIPSTSLEQATLMQRDLETRVTGIPEVAITFSRTGTAELASDPMPPYLSDTFFVLKRRADWPDPSETKDDVRRRIETILGQIPGNGYEFTQPIQMRFNELLAGVRSDLAVKVFGDDFAAITPIASRVAEVLRQVPGAADTTLEATTGAPVLRIDVDRDAIAPYGLSVADVHDAVAVAVGGRTAGQLFQGDRRFDIVVQLAGALRNDPTELADLPVPLSHVETPPQAVALGGDDVARAALATVPLGALATLDVTDGPNQVSRENGKRRIVVGVNVRGRDLGSFVAEARRRVAEAVTLPPGTWLTWGGQFEQLEEATRRLAVVVPLCFVGILGLLFATFGSLRDALIVFSGVPLALSGGVLSLWLRGMPFSISAAVGCIAVSGVAVLNGLVMITFVRQLRAEGLSRDDALVRGALTRLRPVLMTALVASLGFVPMALATGTGAEVQRPIATVVIGGLATSTALTLFVLPALYRLFAGSTATAMASR